MSDNKILQAIDYLEAQKRLFPNSFNVLSGHFDSAIEALQEKAEREKGCEWCNKGLRFECNLIDEEGNTASIKDNVVQTCIADFCPNCGRDLRKR